MGIINKTSIVGELLLDINDAVGGKPVGFFNSVTYGINYLTTRNDKKK